MRDYKKDPLKFGERPTKEEMEYMYLTLNWSSNKIGEYVNRCGDRILIWLREYGIKKSKEQVRNAVKQTLLDRYGVENAMQLQEFKEKQEQTNLKRYGVKRANQNPEIGKKISNSLKSSEKFKNSFEKSRKTCLERYGSETYLSSQDFKQKNQKFLDEHNIHNIMGLPEVQEKRKKNSLEKYGVEHPLASEQVQSKIREVWIEKHGVDNPQKDPQVLEKRKETCVEKYGCEFPWGNAEVHEKSKQTWIERYGVDNPSKSDEVLNNIYETKRKNDTFNSSKEEDEVYEQLSQYFEVKRQYKSDEYPFACDFYLPQLNLYVEYQGNWTHGGKPFEGTDEDLEMLEEWKEKAKTSDFYYNALEVWPGSDVTKRETAKKNSLNWIEFFNREELNEWLNSIKKD